MDSREETRWRDVMVEIRKSLRKQQYDTWFKRVTLDSPGGEEVQMIVPNRFYADWLDTNYRPTVEDAVRKVCGFEPRLRFSVKSVPDRGGRPAETRQRHAANALKPEYTLESFVVGNANRLAHAAVRSVVEAPGTVYNPLFIHGGSGSGKTHLLQALCRRFLRLHPGESAAYISAEDFTNELVGARGSHALEAFRRKYRSVALLALDDAHLLAKRDSSQEEFFHIFNELHSQKQQVVVSGSSLPGDVEGLSERLVSRLNWGLVVAVEPPGADTRLAILKQKARSAALNVPDDALRHLAENVSGSVRDAETALLRLAAVASLAGQRMSVALAREVVQAGKAAAPVMIDVPRVQEVIGAHYGLSVRELVSRKRSHAVAFPRQIGMYLTRTLTNLSLMDIGSAFGGRDHTTVLYACERITRELARNTELVGTVAALTETLKEGLGA